MAPDPDKQRVRTTSDREDAASEDLRVERARQVASLAFKRSNLSFVISFVALILSIILIVDIYLY